MSKIDVDDRDRRSTYEYQAPPRQPTGVIAMPRFMGFVRMEEGVGTPPQALFEAMDAHIGERAAKGVFLDGGGLYGTEDAVNFVIRHGEVSRVDGPYAETKEVVGGWAIMQYDSLDEAVADQREFAELHAKYWPEVTVVATLRQISDGPEAPGD
ncbi:YciI family protein [Terrabacter lapilli]